MNKRLSKRMIYISQGNIPSKWAHTFQAMKQSEALSEIVQDFCFLTSRSLMPSPASKVDVNKWYGISKPFRIVRLPACWSFNKEFFEEFRLPLFDKFASWFARIRQADVVFTRSPGAAINCIRLGLPTIFETHAPGTYDIGYLTDLAGDSAFLGVVTVTESLRNQYINLGIPAAKILVAPDAVGLDRFAGLPEKQQARMALKIPEDKRIALYCGHFYPEKGVGCIIKAAESCPDIQFYLVGGWPDDISKLKIETNGRNNIHFAGFVANDEVPLWLTAADVLILPNSGAYEHAKETSPLKLFEYMAAKRPIIATDIPALKGLVSHQENVFLVAPDEPGQMANAIKVIFRDKALSTRIAQQAWNDVQKFTWKNRAESILRFFATKD